MDSIRKFISKYGCGHEYEFVRNIYSDEIDQLGEMRSEWKCIKCGNVQYRKDYHTVGTLREELNGLYENFKKDKYNSWKELRSETLNNMPKMMREAAFKGNFFIKMIIDCEEKYNDKQYYEKWFNENGLKYECNIHNQRERHDGVNRYEFNIYWI